jgi:hypothetical protein
MEFNPPAESTTSELDLSSLLKDSFWSITEIVQPLRKEPEQKR